MNKLGKRLVYITPETMLHCQEDGGADFPLGISWLGWGWGAQPIWLDQLSCFLSWWDSDQTSRAQGGCSAPPPAPSWGWFLATFGGPPCLRPHRSALPTLSTPRGSPFCLPPPEWQVWESQAGQRRWFYAQCQQWLLSLS